jgi:hypothetical protein
MQNLFWMLTNHTTLKNIMYLINFGHLKSLKSTINHLKIEIFDRNFDLERMTK